MLSAHDLFRQRGYSRVSVDGIAEAAGVTKRTLYRHFRSKDDLLAEIVGIQSELFAAHMCRWNSSAAADAATFVHDLFGEIAEPGTIAGWAGAGFTRIALELTHLPGHPARMIARRHKVEMEAWLTAELRTRQIDDPAGTARDLMLLLEGCLLLVITHNDATYAERAAVTAKLLISGHSTRASRPSEQKAATSAP